VGNEWAYAASWRLDCWQAVRRQEDSMVLLTSVWEVASPAAWRFAIEGSGVRAWLAGQELQQGDLVRLRPGCYPFAITFSVGKVPAFLRERQIIASAGFLRYPAVDERRSRWRERLRRHRGILVEVRDAIAGSALGGQLTAMVEEAAP
jgi:hypothetical protein